MDTPSKAVSGPPPCPNCKGAALIQTWSRMIGRAVVCLSCGVHGPKVVSERGSKEAVAAAWAAWAAMPRHGDSAEAARLNSILDEVRLILKAQLKAINDPIMEEVPDLHPADVIEKHLAPGLLQISPAETLREAMLARRLAEWLSHVQAGRNAGADHWPIDELRRKIECLLNEESPALANLHEAITEAFDAIKVQTQDEEGGPLEAPEYYVPNAKRVFDALDALVETVTRPKGKALVDAARR